MKRLSILLVFASLIISCNKHCIENDTPICIEKEIIDFNTSSICNDASVKEYVFQGSTVYTFEPGTCVEDMTTEVISFDCNSLGYLNGFAGNRMINGEEFSNAVYVKTVWEK